MAVRHKFVYSKSQPFKTPLNTGVTIIERCSRLHGTETAVYDCPVIRVTTYIEGHERQPRQMEAAELQEWLK